MNMAHRSEFRIKHRGDLGLPSVGTAVVEKWWATLDILPDHVTAHLYLSEIRELHAALGALLEKAAKR
jgi:hypothetical protein